jgi:hypothetical protein
MTKALSPQSEPDLANIWRSSLVRALNKLRKRLDGEAMSEADVLDIRRAAKKARGLALMAPDPFGDLARRTMRQSNRARRLVAPARTEAVRRQWLRKFGGEDAVAPEQHETETHPRSEAWALADKIGALRHEWLDADLSDVTEQSLLHVLQHSYAKTRKRMTATSERDIAALHRFRRAVVDLEYRARVMSEDWPALAAFATQVDELRRALGDALDVNELLEWAHERPDAQTSLVRQATETREAELERAHDLAQALLAAKPRAWLAQISAKELPSKADADAREENTINSQSNSAT